jgi:hypothetical protein
LVPPPKKWNNSVGIDIFIGPNTLLINRIYKSQNNTDINAIIAEFKTGNMATKHIIKHYHRDRNAGTFVAQNH